MSFWWEQPSQTGVNPSDQNSIRGSGNGNKPRKLGPKGQHCSPGVHCHQPPLLRHGQGYYLKNKMKNLKVRIKHKLYKKKTKKQVILQSFLVTHLRTPARPRSLAIRKEMPKASPQRFDRGWESRGQLRDPGSFWEVRVKCYLWPC